MQSPHDVIVIGSGIGGMSAALTCARKGRDVLVLEAAKQLGGYINPFQRKHFWFDTGIHYVGELGPGQNLHRQLERMGLTDELSFRELSPDGFDRYVFPDYEVKMPKGADVYRDRLAADFPGEARALDRFFGLLDHVAAVLGAMNGFRDARAFLRFARGLPSLARYHRATFTQVLDGCGIQDPRLRAALAGPGGDIGLPPGKASGLIMLAVISHFLGGAYFPAGGTKAVRDAYVRLLERHGATLLRNRPVERILVENGRVVGVRTARGEEHRAPVVISNADAATTFGRLLGDDAAVARAARREAERADYSLGSICVFAGTDLDAAAAGMDDANVWHYPSLDIDALYAPSLAGEISDELPFFLTVPTLKDPGGGHAPDGKHTVELITFAPFAPFERWKDQRGLKRDDDYKALKDRLGRTLVERAEAHLPGLGSRMEVFEVGTPLTNQWFVNTTRGSIYGMTHDPAQVGLGRFRSVGPVDGLFLCGADIFGAGIATCVSSGVMAGRLALAKPNHASTLMRGVTRVVRGGAELLEGARPPRTASAAHGA